MSTSNKATDALTSTAAEAAQPTLFPPRTRPTPTQITTNLQTCLSLQNHAATVSQKRPFAALLVAPDNVTTLLTHFSLDEVNHAESCLARLAYSHYPKEYLWKCTLYSTWEPCAMCTATIYWAHIGQVVFAVENEELARLAGAGNRENLMMRWACREVLVGGQKDVWVVGPVDGVREEVVRDSEGYWKGTRG
jgi:tRNA(Arg) A34 adenosine deaminase TadA